MRPLSLSPLVARSPAAQPLTCTSAADDPNKVVTVTASDGKSGNEKSISYTSCKVVGNGSFGVVFAAKMLGTYLSTRSLNEQELTFQHPGETTDQRSQSRTLPSRRSCRTSGSRCVPYDEGLSWGTRRD